MAQADDSLRSTKWAVLIAFVGTVLVSFLSTNGVRHHAQRVSTRGFDPDQRLAGRLALASLVIGILAVLTMTGEYGSGHHPVLPGRDAAALRVLWRQGRSCSDLHPGPRLWCSASCPSSSARRSWRVAPPRRRSVSRASCGPRALRSLPRPLRPVRARDRRHHPPHRGRHRRLHRRARFSRPSSSTAWPGTPALHARVHLRQLGLGCGRTAAGRSIGHNRLLLMVRTAPSP